MFLPINQESNSLAAGVTQTQMSQPEVFERMRGATCRIISDQRSSTVTGCFIDQKLTVLTTAHHLFETNTQAFRDAQGRGYPQRFAKEQLFTVITLPEHANRVIKGTVREATRVYERIIPLSEDGKFFPYGDIKVQVTNSKGQSCEASCHLDDRMIKESFLKGLADESLDLCLLALDDPAELTSFTTCYFFGQIQIPRSAGEEAFFAGFRPGLMAPMCSKGKISSLAMNEGKITNLILGGGLIAAGNSGGPVVCMFDKGITLVGVIHAPHAYSDLDFKVIARHSFMKEEGRRVNNLIWSTEQAMLDHHRILNTGKAIPGNRVLSFLSEMT